MCVCVCLVVVVCLLLLLFFGGFVGFSGFRQSWVDPGISFIY